MLKPSKETPTIEESSTDSNKPKSQEAIEAEAEKAKVQQRIESFLKSEPIHLDKQSYIDFGNKAYAPIHKKLIDKPNEYYLHEQLAGEWSEAVYITDSLKQKMRHDFVQILKKSVPTSFALPLYDEFDNYENFKPKVFDISHIKTVDDANKFINETIIPYRQKELEEYVNSLNNNAHEILVKAGHSGVTEHKPTTVHPNQQISTEPNTQEDIKTKHQEQVNEIKKVHTQTLDEVIQEEAPVSVESVTPPKTEEPIVQHHEEPKVQEPVLTKEDIEFRKQIAENFEGPKLPKGEDHGQFIGLGIAALATMMAIALQRKNRDDDSPIEHEPRDTNPRALHNRANEALNRYHKYGRKKYTRSSYDNASNTSHAIVGAVGGVAGFLTNGGTDLFSKISKGESILRDGGIKQLSESLGTGMKAWGISSGISKIVRGKNAEDRASGIADITNELLMPSLATKIVGAVTHNKLTGTAGIVAQFGTQLAMAGAMSYASRKIGNVIDRAGSKGYSQPTMEYQPIPDQSTDALAAHDSPGDFVMSMVTRDAPMAKSAIDKRVHNLINKGYAY